MMENEVNTAVSVSVTQSGIAVPEIVLNSVHSVFLVAAEVEAELSWMMMSTAKAMLAKLLTSKAASRVPMPISSAFGR